MTPGKSFLRIDGVGKSKRVFGMEKANWRWKAHACGPWKAGSNCLGSSHWSTPFFFICLPQTTRIWFHPFCIYAVIEPENDAEKRLLLFIDSGGRSVVFGTTVAPFWGIFSPLIWSQFGFSLPFGARASVPKFGMTHNLLSGYFLQCLLGQRRNILL